VEDLARRRLTALFGATTQRAAPQRATRTSRSTRRSWSRVTRSRHAPRPGWPPDPRIARVHHVEVVNFVSYGVTPRSDDPENPGDDRLRPTCASWRWNTGEDDLAGATAYSRLIDPAPFREIADEIGALLMFDSAHVAGLIAAARIRTRCPTPTRGLHDAQDAARSARRRDPLSRGVRKKIDSAVFPVNRADRSNTRSPPRPSRSRRPRCRVSRRTPSRSSRTRRPSAPRSRRRASATSRRNREPHGALGLARVDEE